MTAIFRYGSLPTIFTARARFQVEEQKMGKGSQTFLLSSVHQVDEPPPPAIFTPLGLIIIIINPTWRKTIIGKGEQQETHWAREKHSLMACLCLSVAFPPICSWLVINHTTKCMVHHTYNTYHHPPLYGVWC